MGLPSFPVWHVAPMASTWLVSTPAPPAPPTSDLQIYTFTFQMDALLRDHSLNS